MSEKTNDLPSVGTEDALRFATLNEQCANAWKESSDAHKFRMDTGRTLRALVSERDELAGRVMELEAEVLDQCRLNGMGAERESALMGRVRELEGERDQAMRNRDMWKGQCERQAETLGMYHAKSTGLERDGLRYRYMRDLRIEQTGMPGQPCIAMPNGMQSGYYLTEETADHAVDTSIASKEQP